ncbi:MAG TPA: regulatory iron-sulfur-containing complex subunit RicT [Candidatus Dormibacteraeota bacterium]|nr:regulatory iron-sulfur-containing complex subunit RicT [Candidatus Dormibacteraeota bacterium]
MPLVIGVKFRRHGPLNYYDPAEESFAPGSLVVAQTARGPEIGEVVMAEVDLAPELCPSPLAPVLRRATAEDRSARAELDARIPEVMRTARNRVAERGLAVKIARADLSFDGTRILFDFTSEGKVDFRDLAKELAGALRCRVELRQVGARDEARIQDGYGPCGRRLCCSSWLKEFVPVTIKMAKEQGLPLNPTRLNGMCGKLKCCLQYENEQYVDLKRRVPAPGSVVEIDGQAGRVSEVNVVREQVFVTMTETGTVVAVPAETLAGEPRGPGRRPHSRD